MGLSLLHGYASAARLPETENAIFMRYTQQQIKGQVTSPDGPLAAVTVSVKEVPGSSTSTDANGIYGIDVLIGQTLVFSAVGFDRKEIVVSSSTENVTLIPMDQLLDEVVVTGYSSQKKENVTASVATVDQKQLKDQKSPNISNLLQGKVAGVDVSAGSGQPGAAANIRIRGRNSLSSGTSPLWVVDGVIAHGTPNINPNDIASISVLKDAAATTQYGSRGTNGVVVVTTKSATDSGQGLFSVNLSSGASTFNRGNVKLMNSAELWDLYQSFDNQSTIPDAITEDVLGTDYDWFDNGTQHGWLNDFAASYMAKTDRTSVFTSLNYYDEEGSIKGYDYNRLSGRINLEHKLTDRITFKPKINATYTSTDSKQHALYDMMLNMPWDTPYNDDGSLRNPTIEGTSQLYNWYGRDARNYLYDLQYNYGEDRTFDIQSNLDFSYKISDRFTFESTNNLAYYNSTSMSYADPLSNSGRANNGTIYNGSAKRIVRFFNQMLKYQQSLGKHNLSGFAAYEYYDYTYQDMGMTGKGIAPGSVIVGNAADILSKSGTKNDYSIQSGIVQAMYNYDDRYNAQVSYRVDGSSRFGTAKQYGGFYSLSGAWNIHKEEFFDFPVINTFRIRASYGTIGNVPNDYYASFSTYALNAQYNGEPAAILGQYQNANVSWETSNDANIGVELRFLDRINLTIDAYNKNTNGLLYYVEFPSTAGWTGYWDNIGAIRNRGLELALNGDVIRNDKFQWNLGVNLAHNKNKIISLKDGADVPKGGTRRFSEGRDIDSWYMREWAGVDPENGAPLWEVVDSQTGEVSTTSNFNDGTLQFVGNSTPNLQGGISSMMTYEGFTLTASAAFITGATTFNAARQYFDADGAYPSYNQMVLEEGWSRWTPENTDASHPIASYNNNSGSNKISSRYLEDASFFRLRNVTLGYSFNDAVTSKLKVKGLGVFLSADNLWTATKFSGFDPESAIVGNDNSVDKTTGDATAQYPAPKRVIFGLNLTF
ncbi:SusC/RagA family TonB-linked outer membrane protein [Sphingobacterium sp. JB170]|uniref:SusC/RagA family TonB-linked outer membrane protein n=1 Tax=Sphingobacterium sp. JB170 TaxID=1434842 RepID=UPI00097F1ED1|nr:SusC/RagA family TonB-linked outer membrane protein [Sphingobacterium sp. JB170]SJN40450.1 SusC, outer membrane protein involved in starch binding [Sphingobacterium sp. JB170]